MSTRTEVRCPAGPRRLLAILQHSGGKPTYTRDGLVEFACSDCARTLRKHGESVYRVLHQYNFLGELVDTMVQRSPEDR